MSRWIIKDGTREKGGPKLPLAGFRRHLAAVRAGASIEMVAMTTTGREAVRTHDAREAGRK